MNFQMQDKKINAEKSESGSVISYAIGFVLSLASTVAAYVLVQMHIASEHSWPPHPLITYLIIGFAFAQFIVQLFLFLHLGYESGPRWRLLIFLATFSLMLVVVLGSVWIMDHLNSNMMLMTPQQMDSYMTNHI